MNEDIDPQETIKLVTVLDKDWMLSDDYPEKDFLVLVNMDRDVMETFYPKRDLIQHMQKQD